MAEQKNRNPITDLAGIIGGVFMVIAVIVLLAAQDNVEVLIPIAWAFVVLGIVLGAFQYKLLKK